MVHFFLIQLGAIDQVQSQLQYTGGQIAATVVDLATFSSWNQRLAFVFGYGLVFNFFVLIFSFSLIMLVFFGKKSFISIPSSRQNASQFEILDLWTGESILGQVENRIIHPFNRAMLQKNGDTVLYCEPEVIF